MLQISSEVTSTNLNRFKCFSHIALVRFLLQIAIILYFLTEPPVNLPYVAISHSGLNDVSPLPHLFHGGTWSTKPLISGVYPAACMC